MAEADWKLSVIFAQGQRVATSVELWRACEAAGLDMIGVADSPNLLREMYISTAMALTGTGSIPVITYVTNPVSRHPSVTACGFMTLNELAPERIGMGIGSGDSALWSVGKKGAKVALMRDYIVAVKALLRGERVAWEGFDFRGEWSEVEPFDLKVYVACSGPKILRVAAEVADGAIVTMGFSPEDVDYVKGIVAEGLAKSGRSERDFEIWWNAHITFDESYEAAARRSLGWSPSWLTMGSLEGKGIPDRYKDPLRQLNADSHNLNAVYKSANREQTVVDRAKELGLYDWLLSRSPRLFGTSEEVAERLNELGRDHDMKKWIFFATGRGERSAPASEERLAYIDQLTREVRPRLA